METPLLWVGTCPLRMETPLRGRSGGHTGAAPTISHVAPCPKVAGEVLADGLNRKKVAGEVFAADIPRCLSQENSSPPIIRVVYRRKTVRRRYSALFIAGKVLAADIPRCLSQERCSPPIFRAVYRRKGARRRYSALFIAGKVLAASQT